MPTDFTKFVTILILINTLYFLTLDFIINKLAIWKEHFNVLICIFFIFLPICIILFIYFFFVDKWIFCFFSHIPIRLLAFPYQFRKLLYSLNTFINPLLLSSFWFMSYAFDHYYLIIIIIRASIFELSASNYCQKLALKM